MENGNSSLCNEHLGEMGRLVFTPLGAEFYEYGPKFRLALWV